MVRESSECKFSLKYDSVFYTFNSDIKLDKLHLCLKPDLCNDFEERK